jgi:hypothetical protein
MEFGPWNTQIQLHNKQGLPVPGSPVYLDITIELGTPFSINFKITVDDHNYLTITVVRGEDQDKE